MTTIKYVFDSGELFIDNKRVMNLDHWDSLPTEEKRNTLLADVYVKETIIEMLGKLRKIGVAGFDQNEAVFIVP